MRYRHSPVPQGGRRRRKIAGELVIDDVQTPTQFSYYARCEDIVGRRWATNPLIIEKYSRAINPLSGSDNPESSSAFRQFQNWIPPLYLSNINHLATSGDPSEADSLNTALARTNPGRATVSIPVFVGELRDLPKMLRQAGSILGDIHRPNSPFSRPPPQGEDPGGWYLGYQFGWAPLIRDLRRMLQFERLVKQKLDELERLYSGNGLKRRINLSSRTETSQGDFTVESLVATVRAHRTIKTTKRRWATVRWKPVSVPSFKTDEGMRRLAQRLAFGMNGANAADIWDLVPWTWLIDWFSGFGDYISSNSGSLHIRPEGQCVMTHYSTTISYSRKSDNLPWLRGGDATLTATSKYRYVGGVTTGYTMPFLSGGQWSILSALAINRMGRRLR